MIQNTNQERERAEITNFQLGDLGHEAWVVGFESRDPIVEILSTVQDGDPFHPEDIGSLGADWSSSGGLDGGGDLAAEDDCMLSQGLVTTLLADIECNR